MCGILSAILMYLMALTWGQGMTKKYFSRSHYFPDVMFSPSRAWLIRLFWWFDQTSLLLGNLTVRLPLIHVRCSCAIECHPQMNITLIPVSQMSMSDGQPRLEYLKCLMCFSSEKAGDPCSSSLSFRVVCLAAVCSSPHLFTAGGREAQSPVCLNSR